MDLFLQPISTSLLLKSLGLDPIHAEKELLSRCPLYLSNVSEVELLHIRTNLLLPLSLSTFKKICKYNLLVLQFRLSNFSSAVF